ncbi:cationic amino acid transporter 8, vacuolar-like [Dorcoceras hygrometricum]|uniref:Cationic amino acid transporter 8, vacuolar-like n=1 Tax=Dorcoceras hygrometricum TaxID=472368 RepID=A0A2Z7CVL8_9LAMI|nr:cationic amino acid transporter 8, vacuolar-like [Dorcoceras hygrometricum]
MAGLGEPTGPRDGPADWVPASGGRNKENEGWKSRDQVAGSDQHRAFSLAYGLQNITCYATSAYVAQLRTRLPTELAPAIRAERYFLTRYQLILLHWTRARYSSSISAHRLNTAKHSIVPTYQLEPDLVPPSSAPTDLIQLTPRGQTSRPDGLTWWQLICWIRFGYIRFL